MCVQMDGMALVLVLVLPIQCDGASLITITTLVSSLTRHTQGNGWGGDDEGLMECEGMDESERKKRGW